jgi:RNA polymerase sigma factor (sigma-70 family)
MPNREPTVFVVDDDAAVREGLQALLESEGLRTATYASAEAFLAAFQPGQSGCLVVDVRMRGMSGLELQSQLAREQLGIPVIIISGHGDIPTAVRAVKTGALDFLEKPVDPQVLLERIRDALRLAERTRQEQEQRRDVAARWARLTPQERRVMELMVAGRANKEIAAELGVKPKTVEVHRKHVLEKMGVTKTVALARLVTTGRLTLSSDTTGGAAGDGVPAG